MSVRAPSPERCPLGPLALAALLAPLLGGCIELGYDRVVALMPVPEEDYEGLVPGESTLTDCLEQLGAPTRVTEVRGGAALAWTWLKSTGWNVAASIPLTDSFSGSVTFVERDERVRGVLLLFDERWVLTSVKRGLMRDLERELDRRRPQLVEEGTGT